MDKKQEFLTMFDCKGIYGKMKEVVYTIPNGVKEAAENCMKIQNEGMLEKYLDKAKTSAKLCDVRVCDVYSKWKTLYENGVNITELLGFLHIP